MAPEIENIKTEKYYIIKLKHIKKQEGILMLMCSKANQQSIKTWI